MKKVLYIKFILSYEDKQSILKDLLPTKTQSVCIMINVAENRALTVDFTTISMITF